MPGKRQSGFTKAGDTDLIRTLSGVPLSATTQKLLNTATEIRLKPDEAEAAFMARQLVLCTLPHSNPGDVPVWRRTDGNSAFAVQPGVDAFTGKSVGIPYGTIPRLLLFWVTTEAVRTHSAVFELGDTLAEFMRELGLDPSRGGKRSDAHRLKEQATRLFSASITFQHRYPAARVDMKIGKAQLWWNPKQPDQAALWGSRIELTHEFFQAITAAPIPLDTRALRALRRSPLALDLYALVTYRAFIATRKREPQAVMWTDLQKQFGADYGEVRNLRTKVTAALRKIQVNMPGLKLERHAGGFTIQPGSLPAIRPKR